MSAEESAVLVLLVTRAGEVELHLELWSQMWGLCVRMSEVETAQSE